MRTFDLIKFFFQKLNTLGLYDLKKESSKQFFGRWAWRPHDIATPLSFWLQIAEYEVIVGFLY